MDELRDLKDEAAQAMSRELWKTALKCYGELADCEPLEGTWPLRAGDAARKLGTLHDAIAWYERGAATYAERGFVVRAIAVGKMIESLDPGNDRILRVLDAAQKQPEKSLPPPPPKGTKKAKPPPLPRDTVALPAKPKAPPHKGGMTGPPLTRLLSGPPLTPIQTKEVALPSMEIVFDDVDDGIPIQASDILHAEDVVEVLEGSEGDEEEELLARLPAFPIFQVLPQGPFLSIVSKMDYTVLEPGKVIVRQGDSGTSLYAIIEGEALVYLEGHKDHPLATLETGEVFGEMALILDQPRAATVEALTTLELFEMDRELFRAVLDEHPPLTEILSRMIKRRLVENVTATASLFQQLDPSTRKELMLKFEVREVEAGTKLV